MMGHGSFDGGSNWLEESESFTAEPLRALAQISEQHRPITNQDLETLKQQIDMVLAIPASEMRPLHYSEMIQGVAKYGPGAVCIGDFVIKRR